ncbi:MAG: hypothetical protein VB034_08200 [Eubacteriales bacterium]|nr:hypothetical protein [Eubacteriales bacterium]
MKIKAKWIAAIVFAVSIILISIILFSLVEENDYFWVTYWFSLAALTVLFAVLFYYLSDAKRTFRQFPANAPYAYVALQYAAAQAILAAGMWVICSVTGLKLKYFVSAELLLMLVFGIRLVLAFGSKRYVTEGERTADEKYQGWQTLVSEAGALRTRAESLPQGMRIPVADALSRLYEAVRYADPAGTPEVADLEQQIRDTLSALRFEIGQNVADPMQNLDTLLRISNQAEGLIRERGDRLKIQKS